MSSSTRGSEFHFVNLTSVTFYRHLHILHHGNWRRQPLEAIQPRQEMVCLSEATRSLGTFSGKIQYAVILSGIEYIICSEFEIPVLGENKHVSAMGCNVDSRAQGLPEAKSLFELTYSADLTVFSKFVVNVRETPEGSAFIKQCREELHLALESLRSSSAPILPDPAVLPPSLPSHFLWNVRNIDWKRRLRKAHRSLLIRIVNLTSFPLVLDRRGGDRVTLEEGLWIEFPSEEIPPLCCSEFGCQSDGFLLGTGGSCTYLVANQQGHLLFVWDQPGMGGCRSLGVHSSRSLRVFRHSENLNEGTLVFHVIDPTNPPLIQLEEARALPPQSWGPSLTPHRGSVEGCLSISEAAEAARFGADVLPVLLPYLEQLEQKGQRPLSHQQIMRGSARLNRRRTSTVGKGGEACVNGDRGASKNDIEPQPQLFKRKQVVITSPRAFFCTSSVLLQVAGSIQVFGAFYAGALQGFKSYRSLCLPNSWLLLGWRIGCERYFKVWGPDEKIALKGWQVAGLEAREAGEAVMKAQDLSAGLRAQGLKFAMFVCVYYCCQTDWLVASSSSTTVMHPPLITDPSGGSAALLEGLVEGFRICASALQPEVDKCMRKLFGPDWLQKSKLPSQHVWPGGAIDSEAELIDLEGLLHLMTAYWNEVFEQRVGDPQLLHQLQTTVIWWATQELSRFDRPGVHSFLRVAATLLRSFRFPPPNVSFSQKFGADSPASRLDSLALGFCPSGGVIHEDTRAAVNHLLDHPKP
ncbi:uncharacterized protein LOC34622213 [Cyclospora cayetanensis]|uniref:Uncharacterized protein LOC34622213 n=1 Tax=Cyclospora cayetanensis TaxID=88456 RepID=A0A6P6RSM1_9EIME|nr:uncharacterized protein LOC34622213 [Cyclospora cayetanensis]